MSAANELDTVAFTVEDNIAWVKFKIKGSR